VVEVDDVRRIRVSDIGEDDARRAGFAGLSELLTYMEGARDEGAPPPEEVFRIALRHVGDGDREQIAVETELSDTDVEALTEKLKNLDARSETGPWTRRTLTLIQKNPRIAASKLAPKLKLKTLPFKERVRKLKRLGLTQSFEVGYEVSPRGAAFLARRKRW
jgi:hypothetical protein